jgi:hypothetical protein
MDKAKKIRNKKSGNLIIQIKLSESNQVVTYASEVDPSLQVFGRIVKARKRYRKQHEKSC